MTLDKLAWRLPAATATSIKRFAWVGEHITIYEWKNGTFDVDTNTSSVNVPGPMEAQCLLLHLLASNPEE